jgi:hypothetical protein
MIANSFVMNADNATIDRFIPDQPIVYWRKNGGFIDADFVNFVQKTGRFLESIGKLTDRQMAAVKNLMRSPRPCRRALQDQGHSHRMGPKAPEHKSGGRGFAA